MIINDIIPHEQECPCGPDSGGLVLNWNSDGVCRINCRECSGVGSMSHKFLLELLFQYHRDETSVEQSKGVEYA